MNRANLRLLIPAISLIALLIIGAVVYAQRRDSSEREQQTPTTTTQPEQLNMTEETTNVQPDINTQEFKLTSSTVNCSTSMLNGDMTRNCSGNIRVTPRAQSDMEPGLYKINENTKLLKNAVEQDLNTLQQLAQSQAFVRLTLAEGSEDTLSEIRY